MLSDINSTTRLEPFQFVKYHSNTVHWLQYVEL